jgi:hypothetical protein
MRMRRFLGSALLAVAVGVFGFAATASANEIKDPLADPQTTNIPYVGWVGTQLRLAKCLDLGYEVDTRLGVDVSSMNDSSKLPVPFLSGKFTFEGWTGSNTSVVDAPFFVNGSGSGQSQDVVPTIERYRGKSVDLFTADPTDGLKTYEARPGDEGYRLCFSVHVSSYGAGLARIKLAVRDDFLTLFPGQDPWMKHQFLAIFMTATQPELTELPYGGDPTGNGTYNPGQYDADAAKEWAPGLAKVAVKGTFPYGNFSNIQLPAGQASYTLPDDWQALANLLATDNNPATGGVYGSAPSRWDIHDDTIKSADVHTSNACPAGVTTVDTVDNCLGTVGLYDSDLGPFSRDTVNHPFAGVEIAFPAIGPFDPLRPNTTFLPDGKVDAGDAPMPALRIDLDLAQGSIGSLAKADKTVVFSRNGTGAGTAHNLYAPFYKAYIPAASAYSSGQSGVAGADGNNFPGFLWTGRANVYDYWDTLLEEEYKNPDNKCRNPKGDVYPGPYGTSGVTIYTDEHGEGYVTYQPLSGNENDTAHGLFDLPETTTGINSVCDLSPGVAGRATIMATAKYPEQPALAIPGKNTLQKTINHLASKTLVCSKKAGFTGSTCVETIIDLGGNPVAGAWVDFSISNAAGGTLQPDTNEAVSKQGDNHWRVQTDATGKATVYVTNSDNNCMDIRAENIGTRWTENAIGIERTFKVAPTTGAACTSGTTPAVTPPASTGSSSGSSSSSASAVGSAATVSLGGPVIQAPNALPVTTSTQVIASNASKLLSVKVLQTKLGRYLVVNVKGTKKTAKVKFSFVNSKGKVFKTIVRTVPTNKAFKLKGVKFPTAAISVRTVVSA